MSSISRRNSRSRSPVNARRFSTFATRFECTFCRMSLAGEWDALQANLPEGWTTAQVELDVGEVEFERAASFLAPAQPRRSGAGALRFIAARDGTGTSPSAVRRLLARLEGAGLAGQLSVVSSETAPAAAPAVGDRTLAQSWD